MDEFIIISQYRWACIKEESRRDLPSSPGPMELSGREARWNFSFPPQTTQIENIWCSWFLESTIWRHIPALLKIVSAGERSLGWWMLLYIQWGTKSWKARHWEVRNLFSLLSSYESELVKGDIENFQLSCMVECWNAIFRWKDGELVSSVKHHGDGKQFVVQVFWPNSIHLWCFYLQDWQDLEQLEELTKNPTPGV